MDVDSFFSLMYIVRSPSSEWMATAVAMIKCHVQVSVYSPLKSHQPSTRKLATTEYNVDTKEQRTKFDR